MTNDDDVMMMVMMSEICYSDLQSDRIRVSKRDHSMATQQNNLEYKLDESTVTITVRSLLGDLSTL